MDLNRNSQRLWIEGPIQVITAEFPGLCDRCCSQREDIALCTAGHPSTFRACRRCRNEYDPFDEWVAKIREEASDAKAAENPE
jgi:hypothetical protein